MFPQTVICHPFLCPSNQLFSMAHSCSYFINVFKRWKKIMQPLKSKCKLKIKKQFFYLNKFIQTDRINKYYNKIKYFHLLYVELYHILCLTNGPLEMVAADVMELNSILVKVVQDSQTEFISLSVVWLRNSTPTKRCTVLQGIQIQLSTVKLK